MPSFPRILHMFFTPELLSRRESGLGLLWLAATLGSKSTFKNLPKRSVLTADIAQLCDLIIEPSEPLALRLSSNLMVGVARVYKVKQEIFLSDVTMCFNSLKKVVQELRSATSDAQLQMAQPHVRPGALSLVADPRSIFAMDFDNLVADWDEYLNIGDKSASYEDSEDEFNPRAKHSKSKDKSMSLPLDEHLRADLHTLKEHHDHLLSNSFDTSLHNNSVDPSSSQIDGFGFGFDDNIFGGGLDGLDLGGEIGDELARELGEGWAAPANNQEESRNSAIEVDGLIDLDVEMDDIRITGLDLGGDIPSGGNDFMQTASPTKIGDHSSVATPTVKKRCIADSDKENLPPSSLKGSIGSFSPFLFSGVPPSPGKPARIEGSQNTRIPRKPKRVKLLFDSRTELTDDELKTARAQYLRGQHILRREIGLKRTEKNSSKLKDEIIYGVPNGLHAQVLVDFWLENFKLQVEARSTQVDDEPPAKRRRKSIALQNINAYDGGEAGRIFEDWGDMGGDIGMMNMQDVNDFGNLDQGGLRSSEEPGQARHASHPPSVLGDKFGFDVGSEDALGASQRSSLFPWDHAGPSSSVCESGFWQGSDKLVAGTMESKIRGSPLSKSRRGSSLVLSQVGSMNGLVGFSPGGGKGFHGEDFAFDVSGNQSAPFESLQSDINLVTLEKNSFNFLEYAKMQNQTIIDTSLTFNDIVPNNTTTRHVAATAFYHCLVLATKGLLHLDQPESYGPLSIRVI